MKFLDRAELAHFHTNNEFLKPFEYIIRHTKQVAIQDLVVQSLAQMVAARSQNIKSGWKSIFMILSRVALDNSDAALMKLSMDLLETIVKTHWDTILDFYVDFANCIVDFISIADRGVGYEKNIVEQSLGLLLKSTDLLAKAQEQVTQNGAEKEDVFYLRWFPALSGLVRIVISAPSQTIRDKALQVLFEVLQCHGCLFSFVENHWKSIIFNVIMPLFEDLKTPPPKIGSQDGLDKDERENVEARESNFSVIWVQTIRKLVETLTMFFVGADVDDESFGFKHRPDLIQTVIELIVLLAGRNSENLSQTGIIYFGLLIRDNFVNFTPAIWEICTAGIEKIFSCTIPSELLKYPTRGASGTHGKEWTDVAAEDEAKLIASLDVQSAIHKCAVHLAVLQAFRELVLDMDDEAMYLIANPSQSVNSSPSPSGREAKVIHQIPSRLFMTVPAEARPRWLACLHASYTFSHTFNSNYDLRLSLWKAGEVQTMPHLNRQETQSISTYITLLFHLYRAVGDTAVDKQMVMVNHLYPDSGLQYRLSSLLIEPLVTESFTIMDKYNTFLGDMQRHQRDISSWSPVIVLIVKELLATDWQSDSEDSVIKPWIPKFFRAMISMISVDRPEVRTAIQAFFERMASFVDAKVSGA